MITVPPWCGTTAPTSRPCSWAPFIQTSRLVSGVPQARVGNLRRACISSVAGGVDGAIAPEPRKFFAAHEPASNTRRDVSEGRPCAPFVGSDPPLHAWEHEGVRAPWEGQVAPHSGHPAWGRR